MAFTVTNTFADAATIEAADLNTNFTDVETALSGLTTENLSGSAAITASQIADSSYGSVITLSMAGGVASNLTTGSFSLVGGIADGTARTYTIVGIESMLYLGTGGSEAVTTGPTFDLKWGDHSGGFTDIIGSSGVAIEAGNGQTKYTGFTSTVTTSASVPRAFVLDCTGALTGTLTDISSWQLSIMLTADIF